MKSDLTLEIDEIGSKEMNFLNGKEKRVDAINWSRLRFGKKDSWVKVDS